MVNFKSKEEELYFEWLCNRVEAGRTYSKLMELLYETPFFYSIPLDRNRVMDVIDMQNDYISSLGLDPFGDYGFHAEPEISVLEIFVAMAVKIERTTMQDDDLGDRSAAWFWLMIENLDINKRNSEFNEDYISWVLNRFMSREYDYDGTGSIVKLTNSGTDVREIQLWHQFCLYLSELIERGLI